MEFKTKIGNYIKSDNDSSKIIKRILLSIFIIYILTFIIYISENKLLFLFNTIIIFFINFMLEFLYRKFIRKDADYIYIIKNTYVLIYSVLISLLLPVNISFFVLIIINIFSYVFIKIFGKFFKISLNYTCLILFLSNLYLKLNNYPVNIVFSLDINVFLLLVMIIIVAFLTINDSLKWRITVAYFISLLLLAIVCLFCRCYDYLKFINISFSYYGIILATFIINDFRTTSVIPASQIVYGIFLAIFMFVSIEFFNYYWFYMFILILNFFNNFSDNICIHIKNKNGT